LVLLQYFGVGLGQGIKTVSVGLSDNFDCLLDNKVVDGTNGVSGFSSIVGEAVDMFVGSGQIRAMCRGGFATEQGILKRSLALLRGGLCIRDACHAVGNLPFLDSDLLGNGADEFLFSLAGDDELLSVDLPQFDLRLHGVSCVCYRVSVWFSVVSRLAAVSKTRANFGINDGCAGYFSGNETIKLALVTHNGLDP
jgi:hypothetical protein